MELEKVKGKKLALYCPDGVWQAAIPYILGYLGNNVRIVKDISSLNDYDIIMFSWGFTWMDVSWVKRVNRQVIIGGSVVNAGNILPKYDNVEYFYGNIDSGSFSETTIIPDYKYSLRADPYKDYLLVYSGTGCWWGKCSFCNLHGGQIFREYPPAYVGSIVNMINESYSKLAGLTAQSHTVRWLTELEYYIQNNRSYWAYARADDSGFEKLRKIRELYIGSEYLADSVLKRINKGINASEIIDRILQLLSMGIEVYTNIIIDLAENEDEINEHRRNLMRLLTKANELRLSGCGKLHLTSCKLIR